MAGLYSSETYTYANVVNFVCLWKTRLGEWDFWVDTIGRNCTSVYNKMTWETVSLNFELQK